MDYKIILGLLATILAIFSFYPYLKDIFKKKTKPHAYSWLIWSIIQGVGVLAMLEGGASFGSMGLAVGTLLTFVIFLLSFKYGTRNITKIDTALLLACLVIIVVWLNQEDPLWAVVLVSLVDTIAYIPTYRKTYLNPQTETLFSYVMWVIANILSIMAMAHYSLVTMLYIGTLTVTDFLMVLLLTFKGRHHDI